MRRFLTAAPLASLVWLAGCGGPTVYSVTGKVTMGGQPLEGVSMAFVPDPGNPVQTPGAATTDASGRYSAADADGRGLAPGKYLVGITKWKGTLESAVNRAEKPTDDPYQAYLAAGGGATEGRPRRAAGKARDAAKAPAPIEARFPVEITPEKHQFEFEIDKASPADGASPKPAPK